MFRNIFYENKRSTIHLWETINGKRIYSTYEWVPYIFVPDDNGDIKTIDGKRTKKVEFQSYRAYYEWCKDRSNIYENKMKPEIQFLAERYYKIPDDELPVPNLLIYSIDIEVMSSEGFPEASEAKDPIVCISIIDSMRKRVITFGDKEYTGETDGIYVYCKNEHELLRKFFTFVHNHTPDVLTGWNIWNFDLPYLINRSKNIFGEDTNLYKGLSPINIVRTWESRREDEEMNIDIAGVHILDYYQLYKWYSPVKLESYKLDFVAKFELEKGKVDYSEYKDLRELYIKDYNKFVDYNRVDVIRVDQLEEKKGYIRLIQALSLLTKCPMKYYAAMTQLIEGAMATHYRRNDMCAPYFAGGVQEHFEAAYVKPPQKGMHDWIIDIDITSSYPSHIITLNMSPETYFGRIVDLSEGDIVYYTKNREFMPFIMLKPSGSVEFKGTRLDKFNKALQKGLFAIAPCGSVFITKPTGVIPFVEKSIFFKRKEVKGKMHILRNQASERTDKKEKEKLETRAKELFSLQWAIKILLNAVFGITAVPYSRYFNKNIAEAITSCGRHTIRQGEKFVNEYYNSKELDTDIEDWVAYIDTDSLFIRIGDYFKITDPKWDDYDDKTKINLILGESRRIEQYVDKRIFEETQLKDYNSQIEDFKISFKQEIIAKKALFVKKKKYAYWCVNEEGTPVDKIDVTGLELVRSDSAEAVRVILKDVYELILKGYSDNEISKRIDEHVASLKKVSPEEMAANITVNGIHDYLTEDGPKKGTPWHVKGVWNYRMLLNEMGIKDDYEDVYEGTKGKVLYVKPNIYGVNVITFNRWPKEFDDTLCIDYDIMIEKFFLKKIGFMLEPMGKLELLQNESAKETVNLFFN